MACNYNKKEYKHIKNTVGIDLFKLPARDARILYLRKIKGLTADKVGKLLDLSKSRVSQLEKKSLDKLYWEERKQNFIGL